MEDEPTRDGPAVRAIGAPWVDAQAVARMMNERRLPGVRFEGVELAPAPLHDS